MKYNQIFLKSKKVWDNNLKLFPYTTLQYPDDNLVRLFSGGYVKAPQPPASVMDHGFGHGNNLVFLANRGYQCSGCEISNYLIKRVQKIFKVIKKPVDLRLIKGLKIPFKDESFDAVVSWSVIHYNGTRRAVKKVISELYRVLKPGGTLFLSTIHPKSGFFDRFKLLGNGSYLIQKKSKYDNRQGLTFFVAQSEKELKGLFNQFSKVKIGSVFVNLFNHTRRNAWFLVNATK
jgi:SAM-dependent methyltransferase